METAKSLLLSANALSIFYGEAILAVVCHLNCIPSALTFGFPPCQTLYYVFLIIPLYEFLGAHVLFYYLLMNAQIYLLSCACV